MTRLTLIACALLAGMGSSAQGADPVAVCKEAYAAEMEYAKTMDTALTRCADRKGKDQAACDLGLAMFAGSSTNPVTEIARECLSANLVMLTKAEAAKSVKLFERLATVHGPAVNSRINAPADLVQVDKP